MQLATDEPDNESGREFTRRTSENACERWVLCHGGAGVKSERQKSNEGWNDKETKKKRKERKGKRER